MRPEPLDHRSDPIRHRHPVMGTVASVRVHDTVPRVVVDRAVRAAFDELDRIESVFSTFRASSTISAINRGELALLDAPPEVLEVLDACTWLEHISAGAFRARPPDRPDRIDPAGFVKGWAIERAVDGLRRGGLENWWFGVGGDVLVSGSPAKGRPWQAAIADPNQPGEVVGVFDLPDGGAVCTSGTAERGVHLWDGRDGSRPSALASLTVLGPEVAWADAFATTAYALGEDGPRWIEQFEGYHALAIDPAGNLIPSSGLLLEPVAEGVA
jgi:thiamine biosynthesis lipoprotein